MPSFTHNFQVRQLLINFHKQKNEVNRSSFAIIYIYTLRVSPMTK